MGTEQQHNPIETITDQIYEWKSSHVSEDVLAAFAPPETVNEIERQTDMIRFSSGRAGWDAVEVMGIPVCVDRGVDEVRVLPESIDDLPPGDRLFESPPDQYLSQLLGRSHAIIDEGTDGDDRTMSVEIPFELLSKEVEITDDVRGELGRYSGVPSPGATDYEDGESIYHVTLGLSGPTARTEKTARDAFTEAIRGCINTTTRDPLYATKHYTIRMMTGVEKHRTETVRVGTRKRRLGRVFCAASDLRDRARIKGYPDWDDTR